jgi:hypothetical protein
MSAHHTYPTGHTVLNKQQDTVYSRLWASPYKLKAKQSKCLQELQFVEGIRVKSGLIYSSYFVQLNSYYVTINVLYRWSIKVTASETESSLQLELWDYKLESYSYNRNMPIFSYVWTVLCTKRRCEGVQNKITRP